MKYSGGANQLMLRKITIFLVDAPPTRARRNSIVIYNRIRVIYVAFGAAAFERVFCEPGGQAAMPAVVGFDGVS